MKTITHKIFPLLFLLTLLTLAACGSTENPTPTSQPTTLPKPATIAPEILPTLPPAPALPTPEDMSDQPKTYENRDFGIRFEFPSNWFGPTEYISEQMLRLEVGSDVVYPYGTDPTQRVYTLKNSYTVLIQYSKNDQNTYWKEAYDAVADLAEGQEVSGARSKVIKVRDLELGPFKGAEYISTLSESAQTEPVYARNVVLFDDQSNVLTMMGQPNNVLLDEGMGWRQEYRRIDEANAVLFHQILESIQIN